MLAVFKVHNVQNLLDHMLVLQVNDLRRLFCLNQILSSSIKDSILLKILWLLILGFLEEIGLVNRHVGAIIILS